MVDFRQRLVSKQTQKQTDPIALYETLDRASDKGPLRPSQSDILRTWYETRRMDKDVVIKLHTGQGKTLIGLLILQSKLNEVQEPAIYLCPNKFLIEQTCTQARQFGINYCEVGADGELPDEFVNGRSILIASAQKLFNGRTKFKLGQHAMEVAYVVMDDAHACVDAIRDAFLIRLKSNTPGYKKIRELFAESLAEQGAGTFEDIKREDSDSLLRVPYWDWQEREGEVLKILSAEVSGENEKKSDAWFVWPLLKNMIRNCQCAISGHVLEISPYLPPLDLFGSFHKAKHRIFMSATVTNDAFLVKGLRLTPDTIRKPLTYKDESWSGEKMILIPSLIHDTLERSAVVNNFGRSRSGRTFGIVVLSPSFRKTIDWEKCGSKVAQSDSIGSRIEELRQGFCEHPLVIVNRYDGIDLPDKMCRVLIFDSMPYSENLADRYEENCRATSEITAIRQARTIEQGLGRSVRGEKDYSVIIIVGSELVKFVRNRTSRTFLSSQTRVQIEIGLEVAEMAEAEIKNGRTPLEALHALVNQALSRDEGWKEYYVQQMNKNVIPESPASTILDIFAMELDAEVLYSRGECSQAAKVLQTLIDNHIKDPADKYWYLQEIARFTFAISKTESNRLQISAHQGNRYLLRPRTGLEVTQLKAISQKRVLAIIAWIKSFHDYEQLVLAVDDILARLQFKVKSEDFEGALKELGNSLGFASERPDKEWKAGPDNLWCLESGLYLLVECKNEVDLDRAEIHKDETGQMNNACAWFDKYYKSCTAVKILIIPTNRVAKAAGFVQDVKIMKDRGLRMLRNNIKAFFAEFKDLNLSSVSEAKVQEYIDVHKLSVESIVSGYVDEVKQH